MRGKVMFEQNHFMIKALPPISKKKSLTALKKVVILTLPLLILFNPWSPATHAQDPPFDLNNLYFEFIKTPASNWSLTEDREGFIWLATASDSLRYDGNEFIVYPKLPVYASSVYQDQERTLTEEKS